MFLNLKSKQKPSRSQSKSGMENSDKFVLYCIYTLAPLHRIASQCSAVSCIAFAAHSVVSLCEYGYGYGYGMLMGMLMGMGWDGMG